MPREILRYGVSRATEGPECSVIHVSGHGVNLDPPLRFARWPGARKVLGRDVLTMRGASVASTGWR